MPPKKETKDLVLRTIVTLSFRVLGAISAFTLSLILAKKIGAEQSGYFFLALNIITVISALCRLGFDNLVLRNTGISAEQMIPSAARKILLIALAASIITSITAVAALNIFSKEVASIIFKKPELESSLSLISPSIILINIATLTAMAFQGLKKPILSLLSLTIIINAATALLALLFNASNGSHAAQLYTFSSIASAIFSLIFIYRATSPSRNSPPHNKVSKISIPDIFDAVKSTKNLFLVLAFTQLSMWGSHIIAGAILPASEIAYLSTAYRTAMLTSFILMAVNMVASPKFAYLYSQKKINELRSYFFLSLKVMSLVSIPMLIIIMTFPDLIMSMFGPDFIKGSLALQIISLGQFVNVITGPASQLLLMTGHEKTLKNTLLATTPLLLASAYLMTQLYGMTGNAIITAIFVAGQNIYLLFATKKIFKQINS